MTYQEELDALDRRLKALRDAHSVLHGVMGSKYSYTQFKLLRACDYIYKQLAVTKIRIGNIRAGKINCCDLSPFHAR